MENKDHYTVKEIILGLRSEYQINERKLNELRKYCICDKNKVAGFDFYLFKLGRQKTEIICRILKKESILEKLLREFSYIFKLTNINEVNCTKNDNGYYINEDVMILDDKNSEFSSHASSILNSNFSLNITSNISLNINNVNLVLNAKLHGLSIFVCDGRNMVSNLWYNSKSDSIKMTFLTDKKTSNELVDNILDIRVPKDKLTSYQINMINMSGVLDKEIIFEKVSSKDQLEFMINDDSDKIVLSKIKR